MARVLFVLHQTQTVSSSPRLTCTHCPACRCCAFARSAAREIILLKRNCKSRHHR